MVDKSAVVEEERTVDAQDNGKDVTKVSPLEMPEFYHERVSYKMAKGLMKLNREILQHNLTIGDEVVPKKDATADEAKRVLIAKSEALILIAECTEKRDQYMEKVIKSLPRAWLVESAPAKINDGEWLDYIRGDYFLDLIKAYQDGRAARREETKN